MTTFTRDRAPGDADGVPGDFWVDRTTSTIYGPKGERTDKVNLYATGSFEQGLGQWRSANLPAGTCELADEGKVGAKSLRTFRGDTSGTYFDPVVMAASKDATVYTAAAWVKPEQGEPSGMVFMVSSLQSDGTPNPNLFPAVGPEVMPTGVWSRIAVQFPTADDCAQLRVLPHWAAGGTTTSILFDGFTLVEGSTDPGYFDGDTDGYEWMGTPGDSFSRGIGWGTGAPWTPPPPEPGPSAALESIPHLAWPLRYSRRGYVVVQQDTVDELATNIGVICSFPLGYRDEAPEFGIQDPEFGTLPLDLTDVEEAIETYENRAEFTIRQQPYNALDPGAARVRIEVSMPGGDDDATAMGAS